MKRDGKFMTIDPEAAAHFFVFSIYVVFYVVLAALKIGDNPAEGDFCLRSSPKTNLKIDQEPKTSGTLKSIQVFLPQSTHG